MTVVEWAAALTAAYSVLLLGICAWLKGSTRHEPERPWFDHDRFVNTALTERVQAYTGPPVIAHPCSYGGDLLEYPVLPGWSEDAILATLAEIEAL